MGLEIRRTVVENELSKFLGTIAQRTVFVAEGTYKLVCDGRSMTERASNLNT